MLDPKLLRDQLPEVAAALRKKKFIFDIAAYQALEEARKTVQMEVENYRQQRNTHSKQVGIAKAKGEDTSPWTQSAATWAAHLQGAEEKLAQIQQQLHDWQITMPNIPDPTVPVGQDEGDNVCIRVVGDPPVFAGEPWDHVALGEKKGMLFEAASQMSGARFVALQGPLARLHRALGQWMLDHHVQHHGYTETWVPHLVKKETAFGTGQWPHLAADLFMTAGDPGYVLIPTSEMPVTHLATQAVWPEDALPLKWVCLSTCYRGEAGSYGKDTRGMLRQHQFEKVELVQVTRPQDSADALEALTGHAEKILQLLDLPYRVMALCTGDLGFASAKTYDLEVWLPGQHTYREISSCSNMTDFQARRLRARFKNAAGKNEWVHTLNGSGLAVGRTLIAVLENYQDGAGKIAIPSVLVPYMGGEKTLFLEP